MLLQRFALFSGIATYRPKGGRPRKLQLHLQVLNILLMLHVGSMQRTSLCNEFGIPPFTLHQI